MLCIILRCTSNLVIFLQEKNGKCNSQMTLFEISSNRIGIQIKSYFKRMEKGNNLNFWIAYIFDFVTMIKMFFFSLLLQFVSCFFDDFPMSLFMCVVVPDQMRCLRYKSACFNVWSKPSKLFFVYFLPLLPPPPPKWFDMGWFRVLDVQSDNLFEYKSGICLQCTSTSSRNVHM